MTRPLSNPLAFALRRWLLFLGALMSCGWSGACLSEDRAFEAFSLTVGAADRNHGYEPVEDTYLVRIGARRGWFDGERSGLWRWRGFWEFEAGYWRWDDERIRPEGGEELAEVAATPVFRLERTSGYESGARPFVEGAVGVHLISETLVSSRDMSSHFHFGSHVGAGWYFGRNDRYELALHIQHLSNAGLKEPNPGINFVLLKFTVRP